MNEPRLPRGGLVQKGVLYRMAVSKVPEPEPDPERLEVVRRVRERQVREYCEQRRRAS